MRSRRLHAHLDEAGPARSMVDVGHIGHGSDRSDNPWTTPLGALGNAHEVAERACLKGEGPEDTMEPFACKGRVGADVDAVIADGSALDAFAQMAGARAWTKPPSCPSSPTHGPSCRAADAHHARRTLQRMDQRH